MSALWIQCAQSRAGLDSPAGAWRRRNALRFWCEPAHAESWNATAQYARKAAFNSIAKASR